MSLADTIKEHDDREAQLVDIPEWGHNPINPEVPIQLECRSTTAKAKIAFARKHAGKADSDLGVLTIIDQTYEPVLDKETGEPILLHMEAKKVFEEEAFLWLQEKNSVVLNRLARAVGELNGIIERQVKAAEKN